MYCFRFTTHPLSAAAARSFALANADVVMLVGARLNWFAALIKIGHKTRAVRALEISAEPESGLLRRGGVDAPVLQRRIVRTRSDGDVRQAFDDAGLI